MNYQRLVVRAGVIVSIMTTNSVVAGTHYRDTLIGERASGMGGAYTAISDDPSGAYYNPAGLAFSLESYLSLSANVFSNSVQTFKNIAPGKDYKLKSSVLSPAYFGFSQSMGSYKAAFSIVVPSATLYDQEDQLENFSPLTNKPNALFRKYFEKDSTYLFGPSLAREVGKNLALGFSAFVHYRSFKAIDNQTVAYNPYPSGAYKFLNRYVQDSDLGWVPELGLQYMPVEKWSVAVVVTRPVHIKSNAHTRTIGSKTDANGEPLQQTGAYDQDILSSLQAGEVGVVENFTFTLGNAYFVSKRLLFSADLSFYTADPTLNVKSTYNWALGSEYFLFDSMPLRLGLYSNNSNVKSVTFADVDLIGVTAGLSWLTASSSVSVGVSLAKGSGRGNILSDGVFQTVQQLDWSLALMGSYQL